MALHADSAEDLDQHILETQCHDGIRFWSQKSWGEKYSKLPDSSAGVRNGRFATAPTEPPALCCFGATVPSPVRTTSNLKWRSCKCWITTALRFHIFMAG
jgi:hypothetical protein